MKKTTIAVDAMGGDFGPEVTVQAAISFLNQTNNTSDSIDSNTYANDFNIILVGLEGSVATCIEKYKGKQLFESGSLSIHHATQVVDMDEPPALALKRKKDSSMRVAINLVKEGQADACVSAGNTGALMATARFVLRMIKGISRPAICSTLPAKNPDVPVHMLDLGANVDSSPEILLQFAIMGSVLVSYVDNKPSPSIGLLNVGAEEIKGNSKVKATSKLLSESKLNYVGYVEGDQIFSNKVDLIVCDGFEGNIALKSIEGVAGLIMNTLKEEFKRNIFTKTLALLCLPIMKRVKGRIDPSVHNGATLLGLNGIVIKSHGGADNVGFMYAINEAAKQAKLQVPTHIAKKVSEILEVS